MAAMPILLIEIDGSNARRGYRAQDCCARNCKIRGLGNQSIPDLADRNSRAFRRARHRSNFLGTNAEGTAGFNSAATASYINASSFNVIGGDGPDKRNVIGGNSSCNVCHGRRWIYCRRH